MSEEVKEKVKETVKEEIKEVVKVKEDAESVLGFSPFIGEDDRFDIKVRCYKDKERGLLVDGIDTAFDKDSKDVKDIIFTFKYPSQGDLNIISSQAGSYINTDDSPEQVNLNKLEFARLLVLIRAWSLPEDLTNVRIIDTDPKIIKSVIYLLRDKISLDGIF